MQSFQEWKNHESHEHYFGYHLIMDLAECNDNVTKKAKIRQFVKKLVKEINMIAVGEPIIKYLLPGEPNAGYSMMQLIETSDITAHFMSKNRTVYCDVFSCKKFDPKKAERVVREFFAPKKMKTKFMIRDARKKSGI